MSDTMLETEIILARTQEELDEKRENEVELVSEVHRMKAERDADVKEAEQLRDTLQSEFIKISNDLRERER